MHAYTSCPAFSLTDTAYLKRCWNADNPQLLRSLHPLGWRTMSHTTKTKASIVILSTHLSYSTPKLAHKETIQVSQIMLCYITTTTVHCGWEERDILPPSIRVKKMSPTKLSTNRKQSKQMSTHSEWSTNFPNHYLTVKFTLYLNTKVVMGGVSGRGQHSFPSNTFSVSIEHIFNCIWSTMVDHILNTRSNWFLVYEACSKKANVKW